MILDKTVILIPSFRPDSMLCQTVHSLRSAGFSSFVVVDDGSGEEFRPVFDELARDGVPVLHHAENRGKGAALKTGFAYIAEQLPEREWIVTVDGDGQHRCEDVLALCEAAQKHPHAVILGARDFSLPQVPPKSRAGNRLTCFVFRFFCGLRVSDTQTGLRAFPREYLAAFNAIRGERYEYETNQLLEMKARAIPFYEVPIETVYYEANAKTHFHPVRDSARIYWLILKFSLSSLSCTALDEGAFFLFHLLFATPLGVLAVPICTASARILSSVTNFFINRSFVFAGRGSLKKTILRYYAVAIPQMLLSAGALWLLTEVLTLSNSFLVTLIKICIDFLLFLVSFQIQREWVFHKEKPNETTD